MTPSSASASPNSVLNFTAKYRDPNGGDDIVDVYFAIAPANTTDSPSGAWEDAYCQSFEKSLINYVGAAYRKDAYYLTAANGTPGACSWDYYNSENKHNLVHTARISAVTYSVNGNDMDVNFSVEFYPNYTQGSYNIYMMARDSVGNGSCAVSGTLDGSFCWKNVGTFNIASGQVCGNLIREGTEECELAIHCACWEDCIACGCQRLPNLTGCDYFDNCVGPTCNFADPTAGGDCWTDDPSLITRAGVQEACPDASHSCHVAMTGCSGQLAGPLPKTPPILTLSNGTDSVNSSGLVGYWRLEAFNSNNITEDYSGYGNNGIGGNFQTDPASVTAGKFGNAVEFDGVDDYINIGNVLNTSQTSFTVEAWAKPNMPNATAWENAIVRDIGGIDGTPVILAFTLYQGNGLAGIYGNPSFGLCLWNTTGGGACAGTNKTGMYDQWHHVVGVYNKTNSSVHIYINGTQYGANPYYGIVNDTISPASINIYGVRAFNGTIDEVRIWNRALSPAEIAMLYEFKTQTGGTISYSEPNAWDSDLAYKFYRNTNLIPTPPNSDSPSDGYYYYIVNTTGGANYTRGALLVPVRVG
ncbi:hypothetical protein A3K63_03620 [Candidatus Micrarchaeota archaeon RBG_16_49_10]|nr:MAG: hypothetical protein A3K63_03620 [Candidatus Micrarchaeota archaeon RBG_16_49_10]